MKEFINYQNSNGASFHFIPEKNLPTNLPISTPMNFVFVGSELLMCVDKNNEWNVVCGKIEKDESWQEAVRRETKEEVGTELGELFLFGYMLCENNKNSSFPTKTYFPLCYSFATTIDYKWQPLETKQRDWFSGEHSIENLQARNDNGQILEIYKYIKEILKETLTYKFEFLPDKILEDIPATSSAVFCFNNEKEFCVVRDRGEDFLSLPAGGRSINEKLEESAWRELWEEAKIKKKDLENWQLLGSILVSVYQDEKVISQMQQVRFLCEVEKVEDFDFAHNDYETDFRDFIKFEELGEKVKSLQNDTGKTILNHLKTKFKNEIISD